MKYWVFIWVTNGVQYVKRSVIPLSDNMANVMMDVLVREHGATLVVARPCECVTDTEDLTCGTH